MSDSKEKFPPLHCVFCVISVFFIYSLPYQEEQQKYTVEEQHKNIDKQPTEQNNENLQHIAHTQ